MLRNSPTLIIIPVTAFCYAQQQQDSISIKLNKVLLKLEDKK